MFLPRFVPRCLPPLACVAVLVLGVAKAQQTGAATVSFSCDFPGSNPSHYGFSVTSKGQTSYNSDGKLHLDEGSASDEAAPTDASPFRMDLNISPGTAAHIFNLVKEAHYFQGDIDFKKKNVAFTGEKALTYQDGNQSISASYNYSSVAAVEELTAFFQNLSAVIEFGRRLDYEYRYQKLALDEEMRRMEETTLRDVGPDLPAAVPVLQKIADDPSVINPVRARAMRLLEHARAHQ